MQTLVSSPDMWVYVDASIDFVLLSKHAYVYHNYHSLTLVAAHDGVQPSVVIKYVVSHVRTDVLHR